MKFKHVEVIIPANYESPQIINDQIM